MNKIEALNLFNEELKNRNIEPLTEKDAIDIIYDDMTEAQVLEAASDFANEEHTVKCENKFWQTHDWQQD